MECVVTLHGNGPPLVQAATVHVRWYLCDEYRNETRDDEPPVSDYLVWAISRILCGFGYAKAWLTEAGSSLSARPHSWNKWPRQ